MRVGISGSSVDSVGFTHGCSLGIVAFVFYAEIVRRPPRFVRSSRPRVALPRPEPSCFVCCRCLYANVCVCVRGVVWLGVSFNHIRWRKSVHHVFYPLLPAIDQFMRKRLSDHGHMAKVSQNLLPDGSPDLPALFGETFTVIGSLCCAVTLLHKLFLQLIWPSVSLSQDPRHLLYIVVPTVPRFHPSRTP